jgi:hypothetical protein
MDADSPLADPAKSSFPPKAPIAFDPMSFRAENLLAWLKATRAVDFESTMPLTYRPVGGGCSV